MIRIEKKGNLTFYYKDGKLHRDDDLPAIEGPKYKAWYKEGLVHRDGALPAIESDVYKEWWRNGLLYRDDNLPAIERKDGSKEWWRYGKRYRKGGPAILYSDGTWACYGTE